MLWRYLSNISTTQTHPATASPQTAARATNTMLDALCDQGP